MEVIEGFDFSRLQFDASGALQGSLEELKQRAGSATDVILIAHGFRNDEQDATRLYTGFLKTFRANLARPELSGVAKRKFVVGGVYWPSKPFRESFETDGGGVQGLDDGAGERAAVEEQIENLKAEVSPGKRAKLEQAKMLLPRLERNADAQDEFVNLMLSVLDGAHLDPSEGLDQVRSQQGSDVLAKLRTPIILPTQLASNSSDASGGVAAVGGIFPSSGDGETQSLLSFLGSIAGAAGRFVNYTTWWLMKERAGVVGSTGVAKAVRDLKGARPTVRVHLVGHSLGGRLMAGCAKALAGNPLLQADSLTLLEAAFSHYGFAADSGDGKAGFFRDVIAKKVVKGPLIATYSAMDSVVGHIYALASRVAGDNVRALGDENDPFGGIGRNGAQKTVESVKEELHDAGVPYKYRLGVVNNLDGSAHLITEHGDVTNERVTYAFASAVAAT